MIGPADSECFDSDEDEISLKRNSGLPHFDYTELAKELLQRGRRVRENSPRGRTANSGFLRTRLLRGRWTAVAAIQRGSGL